MVEKVQGGLVWGNNPLKIMAKRGFIDNFKRTISYIHNDNIFGITDYRSHVYFKDLMINKTYQLNLDMISVAKSNRENIPTKKSDLKKAVLKEITEIKNIGGANVGFKYLFELADGTIVTDSVNFLTFEELSNPSVAFTLGFELNRFKYLYLASKKDINDINFNVVNRDKKYLFNLKMNNLGNITSEREDI